MLQEAGAIRECEEHGRIRTVQTRTRASAPSVSPVGILPRWTKFGKSWIRSATPVRNATGELLSGSIRVCAGAFIWPIYWSPIFSILIAVRSELSSQALPNVHAIAVEAPRIELAGMICTPPSRSCLPAARSWAATSCPTPLK